MTSPFDNADRVGPDATRPAATHGPLLRLESLLERLDLEGLFPRVQPVEVELGSGDGSFLVEYAARHPERNFLGVERLLGRLRKIDRRGARAGLTNLRCVRIEAAYFLEYLLPSGSVSALHVYFPDPWPKRKHRRFRLIDERFTRVAARALVKGGEVFLRTDDADYFGQMTAAFQANAAYAPVATPDELAEVTTDFEREFLHRGIRTFAAAYRSVGGEEPSEGAVR